MSIAYISAVITNIPDATLVFDRFHIIKKYNDMLTETEFLIGMIILFQQDKLKVLTTKLKL